MKCSLPYLKIDVIRSRIKSKTINWAGFSFVTTERGVDIIFQSFHLIKVTRSWKCWTLKKTRKMFLLYVKKHGNISLYNKIFKQNEWMPIGCQEIWLLWRPLDIIWWSAFMTSSDSCLSKILHRMMCAPMPFLSWTGLSVKAYNRVDSEVSEKMILFCFFHSFCRRPKCPNFAL